jgi:hypothetical protein
MNTLQPVSVALKFGFIAVLYLFLLWVSRSALRDLIRSHPPRGGGGARPTPFVAGGEGSPDATGMYSASALSRSDVNRRAPRLVVARASGHDPGMIYDLGRGDHAEIRLEDPFASSRHARIYEQAGTFVVEDLRSTNGSYLNEELLDTPRPLHPGDHLRIGESEFVFEVD